MFDCCPLDHILGILPWLHDWNTWTWSWTWGFPYEIFRPSRIPDVYLYWWLVFLSWPRQRIPATITRMPGLRNAQLSSNGADKARMDCIRIVWCCLHSYILCWNVSSHTETRRADGVVISHSAAALHTCNSNSSSGSSNSTTAVISTRNWCRGKILYIITVTRLGSESTRLKYPLYLSTYLRFQEFCNLLNTWSSCLFYDFSVFICVTPCIFNKQRACLNIW